MGVWKLTEQERRTLIMRKKIKQDAEEKYAAENLMPVISEVTNIFHKSENSKISNVYRAIFWFTQEDKKYTSEFQFTEIKETESSLLVIEQRTVPYTKDDAFQVYFNNDLQRENYKLLSHKSMMNFMYDQYTKSYLPESDVTKNFEKITPGNGANVYKIESVEIVPGSTLSSNWQEDMQKIITDKGTFVDNIANPKNSLLTPGIDWSIHVGEEMDNITINYSKGHLWFNYLFKDGLNIDYYSNGQKQQEANCTNDKLDGEYTTWHKNGRYKCRGFYKNGNLEGKDTCWYENGTKKSESIFKDGEFDGKWIEWYENGQKKFESCRKGDNLVDGIQSSWYRNGQKKYYGRVKKGHLDGYFTEWYKNGTKKSESIHKNGELIGTKKKWSADGNEIVPKEDGNT